jgi:hypothetical protein
MPTKTQFYQWPNILAIDAALIAVAWQAALASNTWAVLGWAAYAALGLSVWLTYMADRLFDVSSHRLEVLISSRHRFAKQHSGLLWRIWCGLLILNLGIATQLTSLQLQRGVVLLGICLIYTLLNQKLSRRFFPKEICVAFIYAGGVVLFVPGLIPVVTMLSFAWLCWVNCLIIGVREKKIDAGMQVHSIASIATECFLAPLAFGSIPIILYAAPIAGIPMASCALFLGILHLLRKKIELEDFRVLADTTLLAGAIFAIF